MAKKSERKNRSVRRRMQIREELAKRNAKKDAELNREMKVVFGCLLIAAALLTTILIFA